MPLCAYFVSGKCSYGNKCHNSHIDVAHAVQEEMKVAIQGKQWPLSTFSPFKDEPSLPDLLEDQSYEEVRWNFMLAKVENRLPQFQEDFKRVTMQAFEKMSKLTMPDATVKSYLVDIYGLNGRKTRQMKGGTFGNTFSAVTGDGGGGRSIFDRISSNTTTNPGVFGGSTGSSFGGGGGTSIFGGGSSFGAPAAPQKSIFGQQSVFAQPQQPSQSIFGQAQATQPSSTFFKLPQLGAPQPASGANIFAQPMQTQQPTFGGQATFPSTTSNSIFGGGFSNTQPMSTESIFGGGGASFAPPAPSFGQPAPQFSQSVLAPASFATPAAPVFGQPAAAPQLPQPSVFGQPPVQNVFPQVSQPPAAQSFFAPPAVPPQAPPVSSVFTNPSPFAAPSAPPPAQPPPQTNSTFFAAQNPTPTPINPALYSKMDQLTPQQLEAFRADFFELGKIPTMPPPIELCGV